MRSATFFLFVPIFLQRKIHAHTCFYKLKSFILTVFLLNASHHCVLPLEVVKNTRFPTMKRMTASFRAKNGKVS